MSSDTLSNYVRSDFADRSQEAEQLLRELATEGRTNLLTSERAFLAREMGWDEQEIKRQLRRVNTIMRLQAIAGSPSDREAALTECRMSVDLLAKQGPKLEEKIEKLRAELSGLERDATLAQRRCEQQAEAVAQLRQHCPQDILERVQQSLKIIEATIGQDLRDAKARHHELTCILNVGPVYESPERHLEFGLKNLLPDAVTTQTHGNFIKRKYSEQWAALQADCQREFAEVSQRLPHLQAEYDEAIEEAEKPLNYYSDPKYRADT